MKKSMTIVVGVVVAWLAGAPLSAHHSGSTLFDETTATLKGVVKNWLWSNPHCLLTIEVAGADGKAVQWVLELQSPNTIYAGGYRRTSFKTGDMVTIIAHLVKNGRPYGRLVSSVLADGKQLGDGITRAPGQATP